MRPAFIRFCASGYRKIFVHIDRTIDLPNYRPDPSCYDLKTFPIPASYTVLAEEFDKVRDALKALPGVLSVNGENTAYSEKTQSLSIYPRPLARFP